MYSHFKRVDDEKKSFLDYLLKNAMKLHAKQFSRSSQFFIEWQMEKKHNEDDFFRQPRHKKRVQIGFPPSVLCFNNIEAFPTWEKYKKRILISFPFARPSINFLYASFYESFHNSHWNRWKCWKCWQKLEKRQFFS